MSAVRRHPARRTATRQRLVQSHRRRRSADKVVFGTVETSVCDNYNLEYRYLEGSGIIYLGFGLHAAVLLAVTVVLLTISALVSGSEVAFFSLTPRDLQEMREHDDSRDRAILRMLSDVDGLLATILVTNNLVNICIVILTSNIMNELFLFTRFEFLFKTVLVTFLLLLFGEILPKVFSQSNPRGFARMVVYPVRVFEWICYPLSYVLVRTGGRISRLASRNAEISMEELADAVDLARGSSREEHQMLSGIVSFVNTEVEEIMRPRIDITALDIKSTYEQVKSVIIDSGYSRIPVYDEDLDNIKGALYVKDLLPHITCGDEFGWQQLLRKIYFVPKHKKIDDLLREFQENKIHVAIVVDEYGATQGLVSLEDILEEVVGEISDESDEDESFYERLNDNTYIFDGKTHIVDFERVIDAGEDIFADVQGRAETLAGLMLELRRDLLKKGDTVEAHGIRLTVRKMDGRRVDKIKVVVGREGSDE
ncbi:gliding motility-associated protein GldE [Alistipes sp. Z76]|nr:gliding motility-associated protein GldE [Alistipes sp. Z76]NCE68837.1 gliding motility-associated protein GldE [Muribaculaceae bacterium M3]